MRCVCGVKFSRFSAPLVGSPGESCVAEKTKSQRDKGTKRQRDKGSKRQRDEETKRGREEERKGRREEETKGRRDKGSKRGRDKGTKKGRDKGTKSRRDKKKKGQRQITMFATRNRSLWLNQTQVNVSTGAVCPLGDAFPRVFFIELGCRFI